MIKITNTINIKNKFFHIANKWTCWLFSKTEAKRRARCYVRKVSVCTTIKQKIHDPCGMTWNTAKHDFRNIKQRYVMNLLWYYILCMHFARVSPFTHLTVIIRHSNSACVLPFIRLHGGATSASSAHVTWTWDDSRTTVRGMHEDWRVLLLNKMNIMSSSVQHPQHGAFRLGRYVDGYAPCMRYMQTTSQCKPRRLSTCLSTAPQFRRPLQWPGWVAKNVNSANEYRAGRKKERKKWSTADYTVPCTIPCTSRIWTNTRYA